MGEGNGRQKRERCIEPVAQPIGVGEPGKKTCYRDVGGGIGERHDGGQQPVGGRVRRSPRGVEVGDRAAHRQTARGIAAREMVVAG